MRALLCPSMALEWERGGREERGRRRREGEGRTVERGWRGERRGKRRKLEG